MARLSLTLGALLLAATLASSGTALAQPDTNTIQQRVPVGRLEKPSPIISVSVTVPPQGELLLSVRVYNAKASDAIVQIASRGNLEVVVQRDADAEIKELALPSLTSVDALKQLCERTNLRCESQNGVWVVSRSPLPVVETKVNAAIIEQVEFKDIGVTQLLQTISQQFNVPVDVRLAQGNIPYLRLIHKTPQEAITLIAKSVGLDVSQGEDGTLIVQPTPIK